MESSDGDPNRLIDELYDEMKEVHQTPVQVNPFDENFRKATDRADGSSLPPLSRSHEAEPLDTPQVVSNSEKNNFQSTYPVTEDEDDETILVPPLILDDFCQTESEEIRSESPGTVITGVCTRKESNHTNINDINGNIKERDVHEITVSDRQIFDCTLLSELPRNSSGDGSNKLASGEILPSTNKRKRPWDIEHTNSQILKSENRNLNPIQSSQQIFSTHLLNDNVLVIPTKVIKPILRPKSIEVEQSGVKQKLKNFLKPNQTEVVRINDSSPPQPIPFTQKSQENEKRERNRMAQKRSRMKKKTVLNELNTKLQSARDENKSLRSDNASLRAEVAHLKKLLLAHKDCPVTRAMTQKVNEIVPKDVQLIKVNANHRSPCDTVMQPSMRSNKRLISGAENNAIKLSTKNANSKENFNKKPPLRININKCTQIGSDSDTSDAQSTVPTRIIQLNENGTPEITELT